MKHEKEELVYINCFYYGFYIKKSELSKYNIKSEQLFEYNKEMIKEHKKVNTKTNIQICDNLMQSINAKLNITNSSNTLNLSRVLEQFNSCNFTIVYDLLTFKSIIKIYKKKFIKKCHDIVR